MLEKQYQEEYVEVNLKDLFWAVLNHWRVLLAALLIGGVLLGGFAAFKELRVKLNTSELEKRRLAYETALENYEVQKAQLETDLKNLQEAQDRQQFYLNNAILLRMDQYNVWFISASFCVETEPEVTGDDLIRTLNYASTILARYQAAIDQIDLDEVVATAQEPDLTTVNPAGTSRKMLETSTDDMVSILNLTIRADSEKRAELIYDAVRETIAAQEAALAKTVGAHKLITINEASYAGIDLETGKLQTTFQNDVKNIADSITKTSDQLSALKAPKSTEPTAKSIIKKTVKYGIIGALAGLFAAAFVEFVRIILQDRLNSMDEATRRYSLPVLGTVAETGKKSRLDAYLAKRLGFNSQGSAEKAADFAASNIRFHLKDGSRVLLVGNCGQEKLDALKAQLASRLEGVEVTVAGNVNENSAAVDALRGETAVVCVEEWMKTPHKEIRRELQTVADSGNRNLGLIAVR